MDQRARSLPTGRLRPIHLPHRPVPERPDSPASARLYPRARRDSGRLRQSSRPRLRNSCHHRRPDCPRTDLSVLPGRLELPVLGTNRNIVIGKLPSTNGMSAIFSFGCSCNILINNRLHISESVIRWKLTCYHIPPRILVYSDER